MQNHGLVVDVCSWKNVSHARPAMIYTSSSPAFKMKEAFNWTSQVSSLESDSRLQHEIVIRKKEQLHDSKKHLSQGSKVSGDRLNN